MITGPVIVVLCAELLRDCDGVPVTLRVYPEGGPDNTLALVALAEAET